MHSFYGGENLRTVPYTTNRKGSAMASSHISFLAATNRKGSARGGLLHACRLRGSEQQHVGRGLAGALE